MVLDDRSAESRDTPPPSGPREASGLPLTEDRHKAPSSTLPFPLSLQDAGIFISQSGCQNHQDGGDYFISFAIEEGRWIG